MVTIAVILEGIARQDIDDFDGLVDWLDGELRIDLKDTLDRQMLLGEGLADPAATPARPDDDFEGIFFTEGIQVQSFDTNPSRSLRIGMAKIEAVGHPNTALCMNPLDFAEVELEVGGAGAYRGDRSAVDEEGPRGVWQTPVASVPEMPRGLAVVGDLKTVKLWNRSAADVRITETHAESFVRNELVARAELRAAFGVQTPQALAVVKLNPTVKLPGQA